MNITDRFLLALYTLAVMAALFVIGLAAAGWTTPVDLFRVYVGHANGRAVVGVVVILLLIVSGKFLLRALSSEKRPHQAIVQETGLGQVRVSVEAIENMVHRVVNQISGVREVKPRVACLPDGVSVFMRISVSPEINIPQTTDQIQGRVGEYIEEVAGIKVHSVKILVDSVSSEAGAGTTRKLS